MGGGLGEGRGKLSSESFPLPSPEPPPISFQRLLTGGEAARREFGSAEGEKWGTPGRRRFSFFGGPPPKVPFGVECSFCRNFPCLHGIIQNASTADFDKGELSLHAWGIPESCANRARMSEFSLPVGALLPSVRGSTRPYGFPRSCGLCS